MRYLMLLASGLVVCGCSDRSEVVTLYRSPVIGPVGERIHVGTFDAKDGRAYNWENCQIAARLLGSQPGVTVRYWCEVGPFRP